MNILMIEVAVVSLIAVLFVVFVLLPSYYSWQKHKQPVPRLRGTPKVTVHLKRAPKKEDSEN